LQGGKKNQKPTKKPKHKNPTAANDKIIAAFDRDGVLRDLF